jgi:predicted nucleic acid-binding protein
MSGRAFFDSNILIYGFGPVDATRSRLARELILEAGTDQSGVVSYQVIQEFLNVAQKKFRPLVTHAVAEGYLKEIVSSMEILPWSMRLMSYGLSIKERYGFSWYDSLIVAAAMQSDCSTLYTEDLQHGQRIEGLAVVNPFL